MNLDLKEHLSRKGDILLYSGNPNLALLEEMGDGPGDIWHSSFEQGFKNAFPEQAYQSSIFFWYVRDFDNLEQCVSWRINPENFAVRKNVWEAMGGFDPAYEGRVMQALHFGYNALFSGAIPMYIKGLFTDTHSKKINISAKDRYAFFIKNYKLQHAVFMIYREGFWKLSEWRAFFYAKKRFSKDAPKPVIRPRKLEALQGAPKVSYIIPTMSRQDYTLQLLRDLSKQTYPPSQVVVVDATPKDKRDESLYDLLDYPFELNIIWQQTKGSCRARNEGIAICEGDYIIFGDDDIRLKPDFVENHICFLQTNKIGAANGLDIMADHHTDGLEALDEKLGKIGDRRWLSGAAQLMSNSNACVKREYVDLLVGNDINYDGGYGEDNDFGLSLVKSGVLMMQNPYSVNLHLKPPAGGYRVWGMQAKIVGKKRKKQPWELDSPVKWVRPVPSPTLMYYYQKHFGPELVTEYRHKYFFLFLFKGPKWSMPYRFLRFPYKQIQFNKSVFYAKKLLALGKRTK
jgi:glycosyltransferase involved in cell wall biosynthesis